MSTGRSPLFAIVGDPRFHPLEARVLNAVCLLNGLSNLGGAIQTATLPGARILVPLHVITGLLFLAFYGLGRFRGAAPRLAWPTLALILVFLAVNVLWNHGSTGGAHYYWIPALVIGVVVVRTPAQKAAAVALFLAAAALMFLAEEHHPAWFPGSLTGADPSTPWTDRAPNFLFVQAFTGGLVWILAVNLAEERRRAQRLLLNILPPAIADELQHSEHITPRLFEETTVLFTDFVGFTRYAEGLEPARLVEELDECCRAFDAIAARHQLEKIKTIGDAYMAVAGIPEPHPDHAAAAVRAALEIRDYVDQRSRERRARGLPSWEVRIGLNSGPLVAGVIGSHKFIYDVWGDTVNTASRMESAGVTGQVNISAATFQHVHDRFPCLARGSVEVKGKGKVPMFQVTGAIGSG